MSVLPFSGSVILVPETIRGKVNLLFVTGPTTWAADEELAIVRLGFDVPTSRAHSERFPKVRPWLAVGINGNATSMGRVFPAGRVEEESDGADDLHGKVGEINGIP